MPVFNVRTGNSRLQTLDYQTVGVVTNACPALQAAGLAVNPDCRDVGGGVEGRGAFMYLYWLRLDALGGGASRQEGQ